VSLLHVQGLRKSFGERLLLNIDTLQLQRGRSYMLTGINGAGKTTLLRILAGLEPGEISSYRFDGQAAMPDALAPRVVYLHQHPYLFHSSVFANIAYGLKGRGLHRQHIAEMVQHEITWAGLEQVAHISPAKLSGGEKQRVALARARVLKPELWLLDEPTASLDAEARQQVSELIGQIRDTNNCVLVATHDQELANLTNATHWALEGGSLVERS
jgi:tungstate transport system ATP-binding protein